MAFHVPRVCPEFILEQQRQSIEKPLPRVAPGVWVECCPGTEGFEVKRQVPPESARVTFVQITAGILAEIDATARQTLVFNPQPHLQRQARQLPMFGTELFELLLFPPGM